MNFHTKAYQFAADGKGAGSSAFYLLKTSWNVPVAPPGCDCVVGGTVIPRNMFGGRADVSTTECDRLYRVRCNELEKRDDALRTCVVRRQTV